MKFREGIDEIVREDRRYAADAYFFVREGLGFTQDMLKKQGHVTGQELLEGLRSFALGEFGYMARVVLESWGVRRTEDIGEIVFNMVNHGVLGSTEDDTMADFTHGYDFRKAFDDTFRLELPDDIGS